MQAIFDALAADEKMSTLVRVLKKAGLDEMLQGDDRFTLFAPDNDAFIRMDIEKDLDDPEKLKSIMKYHLVSGKYSAADIKEMETLTTTEGKALTITLDEGSVVVDNGKFIKTDIECSNGVIQVIDNVFKPQLSGWYRDE
ncbi:MAG: fasciclin domain-containing protein [Desulfuromonadales bacterium]|nr:fasciclin domain-containing protein [Desulfuromonadales bacterium]